MANRVIELMDDMHLSSQATFLDFYKAMEANNISQAENILAQNPEVANQIMNAENINTLLNEVNRRELMPKIDIDYFLEGLLSVFQKMIDYTKVMGEWNAETQYNVHNLVYYKGKGYFAYTNTQPPLGTPPTNTEYWREYDIKGLQGYGGFKNLNYLGAWSSTTAYKSQDVVIFQNKMWMAIANNQNTAPNLNHYPWSLIMLPDKATRTPIQKETPTGYNIGDFWFQITQGDEIIQTSWTVKRAETTPRFASGSFMIDNMIYVIGGKNSSLVTTALNEAYDTLTNTWSKKADYPVAADAIASFAINNVGYCAGGLNVSGVPTNKCYTYNPTNNTWTAMGNFPISMSYLTSVAIINNEAYIAGFITPTGIDGGLYKFTPSNKTWTKLSTMPVPRYASSIASVGNKIYFIGGGDLIGNSYSENQIYDTTTKTWSKGKEMKSPRSYMATFENEDKIFCAGGLDELQYSTNICEVYEPATNTWKNEVPMRHARNSMISEYNNVKGYVIGGIDISTANIAGYVEEYTFVPETSDFVMIVDTSLGDNTISIPMTSGGTYDYIINWGDGTTSPRITSYQDTKATHTYSKAGEYQIKITGTANEFKFTDNVAKCLKEIPKCVLSFRDISNMFLNCANLTSIVDDIFAKSSTVTSAAHTFEGCKALKTIPLGLFDNNSKITNFSYTFAKSGITSIPTGLFDACIEVTNFSHCFRETPIVSIPVGLFNNNPKVTNFASVFTYCSKITTIPNQLFINNPIVSTYNSAFGNCTSLVTLPSNLFGTAFASVKEVLSLFSSCKISTIPSGIFQYGTNITSYNNVFAGNPITIIPDNCFNGNNATITGGFAKTNLKTIGNNAFKGLQITTGFLQDSPVLTTVGDNIFSNVTTMTNMFLNCPKLTRIGNIDYSNVTVSQNTFNGCTALTTLKGFKDSSNEPSIKVSFDLRQNPNLTHESLINVSNSLVKMPANQKPTLYLHANGLNLLTEAEKLAIINKNWNISGYTPSTGLTATVANELIQSLYGNSNTQALSHIATSLYYYVKLVEKSNNSNVIELYAVDKTTGLAYKASEIPTEEYVIFGGTDSSTGKTIYVSKTSNKDTNGAIFKQQVSKLLTDNPTYKVLKVGTNYTGKLQIKNSGLESIKDATELFKDLNKLTTIQIYGKFAPTAMLRTFMNCNALTALNFSNIDTSQVTTMAQCFEKCHVMENFDFVSKWNTKKVANMSGMFETCKEITSIPTIDMTNVTIAQYMFSNCSKLATITPNIIGQKIQSAIGMFNNCIKLNLDKIKDFTTIFGHNSNLTNVSGLFKGCTTLTDVGTHNVFDVDDSAGYPELKINATKANNQLFTYCPNITNMSSIFMNCTNLGNNVNNCGIPMGLFYNCHKLTNISHAFDGCKHITVNKEASISIGVELCNVLFVNNPELVDVSYLFANVTTDFIGENTQNPNLLFPVQTKIQNASYLWKNCNMTETFGYETIPFIYKSKVLKNIEGMFQGQTYARILPSMGGEYDVPAYDWSKLDTICPALENCSKLFDGNTNLTDGNGGTATKMINSLKKIKTLTNHAEAFKGCTKLSDYNSIPADWK
jgi:surface protein